jgi:hypothetical protein
MEPLPFARPFVPVFSADVKIPVSVFREVPRFAIENIDCIVLIEDNRNRFPAMKHFPHRRAFP